MCSHDSLQRATGTLADSAVCTPEIARDTMHSNLLVHFALCNNAGAWTGVVNTAYFVLVWHAVHAKVKFIFNKAHHVLGTSANRTAFGCIVNSGTVVEKPVTADTLDIPSFARCL